VEFQSLLKFGIVKLGEAGKSRPSKFNALIEARTKKDRVPVKSGSAKARFSFESSVTEVGLLFEPCAHKRRRTLEGGGREERFGTKFRAHEHPNAAKPSMTKVRSTQEFCFVKEHIIAEQCGCKTRPSSECRLYERAPSGKLPASEVARGEDKLREVWRGIRELCGAYDPFYFFVKFFRILCGILRVHEANGLRIYALWSAMYLSPARIAAQVAPAAEHADLTYAPSVIFFELCHILHVRPILVPPFSAKRAGKDGARS
jgi:hypothetical protein